LPYGLSFISLLTVYVVLEGDMSKRKRHTLSRNQISIVGEAEYIISRAQKRGAHVVRLGRVVFFSTETGDAWMIDCKDNLALCLARDGIKQDYMILETEDSFRIGWKAQYEIKDNIFIVALADGSVKSIMGYPTEEIVQISRDTM